MRSNADNQNENSFLFTIKERKEESRKGEKREELQKARKAITCRFSQQSPATAKQITF